MYLDSHIARECCGCTACEQICPKKCVRMEKMKKDFSIQLWIEINV